MDAQVWPGYTEQEYQLALFVQQRVYQHFNLEEEERDFLRGLLALVALWHLNQEGRIRFEVPEEELLQGLPPGLPLMEKAREAADAACKRHGLSVPLKDLLYLMVLVDITYQGTREGRLTWLGPPR